MVLYFHQLKVRTAKKTCTGVKVFTGSKDASKFFVTVPEPGWISEHDSIDILTHILVNINTLTPVILFRGVIEWVALFLYEVIACNMHKSVEARMRAGTALKEVGKRATGED